LPKCGAPPAAKPRILTDSLKNPRDLAAVTHYDAGA
jgi:hypothetical protein